MKKTEYQIREEEIQRLEQKCDGLRHTRKFLSEKVNEVDIELEETEEKVEFLKRLQESKA